MGGKGKKQPRAVLPVPVAKRVPGKASLPAAVAAADGLLLVRFNEVDVEGPWCLSRAEPAQVRDLFRKVAHWEKMRTLDVFNGGRPGKDYVLDEIPNPVAQQRLRELGKDDQDRISRIRLDGPGRLYGFRRGNHFHALWFDTRHEVWPSNR